MGLVNFLLEGVEGAREATIESSQEVLNIFATPVQIGGGQGRVDRGPVGCNQGNQLLLEVFSEDLGELFSPLLLLLQDLGRNRRSGGGARGRGAGLQALAQELSLGLPQVLDLTLEVVFFLL